jgi:hypothetical protein
MKQIVADGALGIPDISRPRPGFASPFQMKGFRGIQKVNWLW